MLSGRRPHQPVGDHEQRDRRDELQVRDREEQGHDRRGRDPQDNGTESAEDDRGPTLTLRKSARSHPDDQRVVPGEGEVDQHDREDRLQRLDHLARHTELADDDIRDAGEPEEYRGDVPSCLKGTRELHVIDKPRRDRVKHHDSILSRRERCCRYGDMR